jgi:hypothetical protein
MVRRYAGGNDHGNGHTGIAVHIRRVHVDARSWLWRVGVQLDAVCGNGQSCRVSLRERASVTMVGIGKIPWF